MSAPSPPGDASLTPSLVERLDPVCDRFEAAWTAGQRPRLEDHLAEVAEADRPGLARELIRIEVHHRRRAGDDPRPADYQDRFPELDLEWLATAVAAPPTMPTPSEVPTDDPDAARHGSPPAGIGDAMVLPGYEILGVLGRGGMGVVYKARQVKLNRVVALKMILSGEHAGPEELSRFRHEAEAVAQFQHPHIVQIYEVGEWRAGPASVPLPWFSLEYVDGGSLAQRLDGTPVPATEAARLVEKLARAVQHAHQRGILHRDLKPANVLLVSGGVVRGEGFQNNGSPTHDSLLTTHHPKITDFGLAKRLEQDAGQTRSGAILGTPSYMAPEQAGGPTHAIGPAADVYALGAILYELLTGRPPFRAATVLDTLEQVRSQEPVSAIRLQPTVPRDLNTICLKCLAKDPARRYPTALELAEDLRRWQALEPIQARPVSRPEKLWHWCRRHPAVAGLIALVALLLLLMAGGALQGVLWLWEAWNAAERAHDRAVLALEQEKMARHKEGVQRRRAEELLERQYVAQAVRHLDASDCDGALPWILEGLRLVQGDPEREEMHRLRLGAALRLRPRSVHVWFHDGPVRHAEFSPDGRRVVTASRDHTARVWEAATGQPMTPPLRHTQVVCHAAFSPDGRRVATASADMTARVWDATTGEPISPPLPHTGEVGHAAFSPDGRHVVTASKDHTARLWDAATGQSITPPLQHGEPVLLAAFCPDGQRLVTASTRVAQVWDAGTGRPAGEPLPHGGTVNHAAFSPDGGRLVTASYPSAQLWDTATGRRIATLEHITTVSHAAFSPDGRRVVTASLDNTARVWDAATGQPVSPPLSHGGWVHSARFRPDGRVVVTACGDGTVRQWDAATGVPCTPSLRHAGAVRCAVFSPDGRRILTAGDDETARLWDPSEPVATVLKHQRLVHHATFASDGCRVATASWDGTAQVWDVATGRPLLDPPLRHRGPVRRVVFSRDGRRLATASLDGTARVWDATTGVPVTPPLEHQGAVHEVFFNREGRRVVTASADGTARVWDATTGLEVLPPLKHLHRVHHAEFSRDGTRVVTGSGDSGGGTAQVWDVATGRLLTTLKQGEEFLHAAFSPDDKQVVTTCGSAAQVWDAASGQPVGEPLRHNQVVPRALFSPDGRRVVTASADSTARVWDAATGQPITPPLRHDNRVLHALFSPDGRRVATASMDGTARVWDATTGTPVTPPLRHDDTVWHAAFSPDGRRLVTTTAADARVWELPFEDRPLADLVRLAQVLTGQEMRAPGQLVPLTVSRFRTDWAGLRSKYPHDFPALPANGGKARPTGERLLQ